MKLKELEKPYKAETHRDHFTKAQDLITSAIFSGWKIRYQSKKFLRRLASNQF